MKKYLLISFICTFLFFNATAQDTPEKKIQVKRKSAIGVGVNFPVGEFSRTHTIGFSVVYNSLRHDSNQKTPSRTSFTWNGGAAYYIGKKETGVSYSYKYPAYIFIHGNAGILYSLAKKTFATLTAGPALGFYSGNTKFNVNIQLDINYQINKRILVTPAVILMKEPGANSLWAPGLKAMFIL